MDWKQFAGKPYRPSNGTEGMIFQETYCDECIHDNYSEEVPENGCMIIAKSMSYGINDPKYPKEWVYNVDGKPICTKFTTPPADSEGPEE